MNIPKVISSQSTYQIQPSEIPRTANYSASTAPDPLPHFPSVFFLRVQGGSGAETREAHNIYAICPKNVHLASTASKKLSGIDEYGIQMHDLHIVNPGPDLGILAFVMRGNDDPSPSCAFLKKYCL